MGFRYHVVTVTAVLLALGLGVLLGASSGVKSSIVEKQTTALSNLRQQFDRDIVPLRDQVRRYASFTADVPPKILAGRLANQRIALVQTGDYAETFGKVRDALEQAGATIVSRTVVDRTFTTHLETSLQALLKKLQPLHPSLAQDRSAIMHVLAIAIARGEQSGDVNALAEAKLIERDGDYSRPVDAVVLVGGAGDEFESRAETVDLPLINELKSLGMRVVEVEPEAAAISYIAALAPADIVTVDNAETDIGRIAVVLAIQAVPGDYGVKKSARSGKLPAPASR